MWQVAFDPKGVAIIQNDKTHESDESAETQRNKDVTYSRRRVRLVKCGTPFTIIRNMDAY